MLITDAAHSRINARLVCTFPVINVPEFITGDTGLNNGVSSAIF
jgi:hypothetical protein